MSTTLYKHRIHCLYGIVGQIATDVNSLDTTFLVQPSVLQDPVIKIGAEIYLSDEITQNSALMHITNIDYVSNLITVDAPPKFSYLASSPTNIVRAELNVYIWKDTVDLLTTCPENPLHPVNPVSAIIREIVTPNEITIRDGIPGMYQVKTEIFNIPAGATGGNYIEDISFPYDMELLLASFMATNDMIDDSFKVIVAPDTPISILSQVGDTGATTLYLDSFPFNNNLIYKGLNVSITDTIVTQDLGLIVAYDNTNYTITVQNSLNQVYNAGSVILMNRYLISNFHICHTGTIVEMGQKGFKSSAVPANTIIRLIYTNGNGLSKKLCFVLQYNCY